MKPFDKDLLSQSITPIKKLLKLDEREIIMDIIEKARLAKEAAKPIVREFLSLEEIEEIVNLLKAFSAGYPEIKVPSENKMRLWCDFNNYLAENNLVLYTKKDETTIPSIHKFASKAEVRVYVYGFPIHADSIGPKWAPLAFRIIVNIDPNLVAFAYTKMSIGFSITYTFCI